jgi:peroxiredoxin
MSMKAIASVVLFLLPSIALGAPEIKPLAIGAKAADFTLRDYRGGERSLPELADQKLVVVAFIGTECPVAKLYSARLVELAKEYEPKGVGFVAISSNQQDSISDIARLAKEYKIGFPILKDVKNVVADQFGAQRTPEVYVLDKDRVVRYHGRVDDQYGVGYVRKKAEQRDLANAIDQLLAGKTVSKPETQAAGCFIGRVLPPSEKGEVTYAKQISRIMQKRCVECHHTGEIAPFSLTSYDEVIGWADTIEEVVRNRRMPPWHADVKYGEFSNDCRLPEEEKQLIYQWVKDGAPQGDPKDMPAPVKYVKGWRIPEPDLIVSMPKPFTVPATGDVVYQFFAIDPGFKEDKWVKASEVRPGNRSVIHHVLVFVQPPGGKPEFHGFADDWLAATVPGAHPQVYPEGMAKLVPAGSRLLFQMHYTPNGTVQTDQTSVALVFADPNTVKREVRTSMAVNHTFEIPPRAEDYVIESETVFDRDTLVLNLTPHTHLRGKAFRYEAFYPNGEQEILLDVPGYDFNWQQSYYLAKPKTMPKGTRLHCIAHYDNSAKNLSNPNPNAKVRWGDQTWEEMMIGYFDSVPVDQELEANRQKPSNSVAKREPAIDPSLRKLAEKAMDSDAEFSAFAAAVKKAVPAVDRVCVTELTFDRLKVLRSAYPGEVKSRFAEAGFEKRAEGFALVFYALLNKQIIHPDLTDRKQARGLDLYMMSKELSSSMHSPVIWEQRPATVNFWSKNKNAFSGDTVAMLEALSKVVTTPR